MTLFPTDIRHQEFSTTMFGYSKKEVKEFLEQLANELEDYQGDRKKNYNVGNKCKWKFNRKLFKQVVQWKN